MVALSREFVIGGSTVFLMNTIYSLNGYMMYICTLSVSSFPAGFRQ